MKTVVITGCKGQGASYAIDKFLEEGYNVIGTYRRCSLPDFSNVEHNLKNPNLTLYESDICDFASVSGVLSKFKPDIWMNFAAQSHVGSSYNQPIVTSEVNYIGVNTILEAIRLFKPDTKFWNANTSERFGNTKCKDQDESTPPSPVSPYAVSKVAAEYLINAYRDTYKMHASYSIMFNFESPRRSKAFVTRKITDYIGKTFNIVEENIEKMFPTRNSFCPVEYAYEKALEIGVIEKLKLGNIDTSRSWTHCRDTIDGVYKQVMLDEPDNFIFGLEESHTIREFLEVAFAEIGIINWQNLIVQDPQFMRPSEVPFLKPNSSKAKEILGWTPKTSFHELVKEMIDEDIKRYTKD